MLMVGVVMPGHFIILRTIVLRLSVSRGRVTVLIAKRHHNRVQVLQRQAGNQYQ